MVGSLGLSFRYKTFFFCIGFSSRPSTKHFFPHLTLFQFFVPIVQQARHCRQAALLGRLSLNLCLWFGPKIKFFQCRNMAKISQKILFLRHILTFKISRFLVTGASYEFRNQKRFLLKAKTLPICKKISRLSHDTVPFFLCKAYSVEQVYIVKTKICEISIFAYYYQVHYTFMTERIQLLGQLLTSLYKHVQSKLVCNKLKLFYGYPASLTVHLLLLYLCWYLNIICPPFPFIILCRLLTFYSACTVQCTYTLYNLLTANSFPFGMDSVQLVHPRIKSHGSRGRTHGLNWDESLESFSPCYSQSSLLTDFASPPPPPAQKWLGL